MKLVFLSSSFVHESLSIEFGTILPVELPVHNKELLFHQLNSIENFQISKDDIFITIPKGYNYSNPFSLNLIHVESELDIFQLLNELCFEFKDTDQIFFYYGDTLLLNIDYTKFDYNNQYFFVGNPSVNYKWGLQYEGNVPAGGIYIRNSYLKKILKNSASFNDIANLIYNDNTILKISNFTWLDFGNSTTFYNSRKNFLESRSFNQIEVNKSFLKKSSKDIFKIWVEYKWLKKHKYLFPNQVPYVADFKICDDTASYSIEYLNFPVLSDIFVFGKLSDDYLLKILFSIKDNLIALHEQFEIKNTSFLSEKLSSRKDEIFSVIRDFNLDETFFLKIYEFNFNYFNNKPMKHSIMHGDYCFSNLLFNFNTFEPILIDPRGFLSRTTGFCRIGPSNYDIYKLAHSYVAGYDLIISNKITEDFFKLENIKYRFSIFCKIFIIDKDELKMGLINLFLSMIPMHNNSVVRQRNFLELIYKIDQL